MDWELLEPLPRGLDRHHRLPRRPRAAVAAARRREGRARQGRRGCRTSSARTTCSSSCRTTACRPSATPTRSSIEIARKIGAPLIATNDSHYVHREDHEAHDALLCVQTGATLSDPKRFKFEGQEHYLKTAGGDALPVPRAPRGVRQHAVDRRAGRRQHRVRQAAAARLPDPRGLRRRRRATSTTSRGRGPGSGGATSCRRRSSSGWPTSCRSSRTWASPRTS